MAENGEKRDPKTHRTPTQMKRMSRGYNARPENVKERSQRNAARKVMEEAGHVKKGDGKDVHHKRPLRSGGTNNKSNLQVTSASKNRGWRDGV